MRELVGGASLLGRGLATVVRRPRLLALGAVPPLVTSVLFVVLLAVLVGELRPLTAALTPFADDFSPGAALVVHVLAGVLLVAGAVLLMVLVFTTLTLALGSPVYDAISEAVDRSWPGSPPALDEPLATAAVRAVRQTLVLLAVSGVGAVVFLGVGVVPVVGQVAAAVGGAVFGGWMLAIELVGSPLERRGVLTLRGRREQLARRRWRSLGLGIPSFLLLSIPFVAVLVFPAATAAGTLLARQLGGEPTGEPAGEGPWERQVTDR